ncbi:hypothetical protein NCC49_003615 [Naganishia albida]|nr:hypothetical protein NCC49_003615 [Naganishia albida]
MASNPVTPPLSRFTVPFTNDPPWSRHLSHLAAPYHDRPQSTLQALSRQVEEAQVRTHHCQILLKTLAETCQTASKLEGGCPWSPVGDSKEWAEIQRKQRIIGAGLRQMQRQNEDLAWQLERSRALAAMSEEEIKTSGLKNGDDGNR